MDRWQKNDQTGRARGLGQWTTGRKMTRQEEQRSRQQTRDGKGKGSQVTTLTIHSLLTFIFAVSADAVAVILIHLFQHLKEEREQCEQDPLPTLR